MSKTSSIMVIGNSRLKSSSLRISNEVAQLLGLTEGITVSLHSGQLVSRLEIIRSHKSGRFLELNPVVLRSLHIIAPRKYGINSLNNQLRIGPAVGIMAETGNDGNRPFRGQSFFIKELNITGRALGQLCFGFDPRSINYRNKTVTGYIFINGSWRRRIFPVPDVVYPREAGYSSSSLQIRRKLEELGCKFINPPLLGKWQTHQILSKNLSLSQYIPDTRKANNFQQVNRMLRQYGSVYIKPITGSQGRDIIRVVKAQSSNIYRYQYKVNKQAYAGTAYSLNSLHQSLGSIMRKRNYIVQRQIDLLKIYGNIADVRVLVQKDNSGEWSVTGKAFRIGKRGSITSNISGGGKGLKLETGLSGYFADPRMQASILDEVDYLALEAAKALEMHTSSIGELGIDIGIDAKGKLWFIEANLKPARKIFLLIGEKSTRRMSIRKPLLYASYLAGFSPER
ncbi:MAG: YheC/YheD family protein [Syntrophomonas sp.]